MIGLQMKTLWYLKRRKEEEKGKKGMKQMEQKHLFPIIHAMLLSLEVYKLVTVCDYSNPHETRTR